MESRTAAAVLVGIVIGVAAMGALLYFGVFTGSLTGNLTSTTTKTGTAQTYQVSGLQVANVPTSGLGAGAAYQVYCNGPNFYGNVAVVSFTLSSKTSMPIISVGVTANANAIGRDISANPVSSLSPISQGQSRTLQFDFYTYTVDPATYRYTCSGEIPGQSYYVQIQIQFADYSWINYNATITGK